MLNLRPTNTAVQTILAQSEFAATGSLPLEDRDLWLYRSRTIALLRRYARASVEVGRLPSLIGREFFRSCVSQYSMKNFEDIVIFVTDMEHAFARLNDLDKSLLSMSILEGRTIPEISRLCGYHQRTVRRLIDSAIDALSETLLEIGLLDGLVH
jgi:DNA-directed RNA polymerase specialized sigma24 family protein